MVSVHIMCNETAYLNLEISRSRSIRVEMKVGFAENLYDLFQYIVALNTLQMLDQMRVTTLKHKALEKLSKLLQ